MSINIGPPSVDELKPKIAVIGVGGAGGNAIANMIAANVEGVDFIVANTDAQSLNSSVAEHRIQLGPDITQGLGAGSRPEVGRAAAEETLDQVKSALEGAHMCFIAAGMGGGTGTGAAPVIAQAAREMNILTVGVVTKPFTFEGTRRMRSADAGIDELQKNVDTLIVIPNQNLFLVANPNTTFKEAFLLADEVLQQGVRGITDLMVMPGLINLDFADVRSVMHEMGKAMMGTGEAEGDGRALEAAEKAIANPLLDGVSMKGAKGVIVSITGGEDMRLMEVDEAANHIRELVDPDANIIWGSAFNENLDGKIRVSVVATGIDTDGASSSSPPPSRGFAFPGARTSAKAEPEPAREERSEVSAPEAARSEPGQFDSAERDSELSEPVRPAPQNPQPMAEPASHRPAAAAPQTEEAPAARDPQQAPRFGQRTAPVTPPEADDDTLELSGGMAAASDKAPASEKPFLKPGSSADSDAPAKTAPRIGSGGGTLFERMSNLSRGLGKEEAEDTAEEQDGDPLNIPRFLGRQNNQR